LVVGVVSAIGVALFTHPAKNNKNTRVSNPTALRGIEKKKADRVLYMYTLC